jgi:6,7-dimethyl-8-ribityllumazine synthase
MKEINGALNAKGLKIGIVVSRFNSFLTEQLVKGAVDAFVRLGGDESGLTLVRVPGAYEIPLVAKRMALKKYDAIIALGAVVQGATAHADLINQATAKAFSEISVETGVPVLDGIVAAENLEQAVERCGTKQGNKGFSSMQAAVEMVNVMKKV